MTVTAIVKDLTDTYLEKLKAMEPVELFDKLHQLKQDNLKITFKIGTGQFRDAVELNQLRRLPHTYNVEWANRRGYKLVTFTFKGITN